MICYLLHRMGHVANASKRYGCYSKCYQRAAIRPSLNRSGNSSFAAQPCLPGLFLAHRFQPRSQRMTRGREARRGAAIFSLSDCCSNGPQYRTNSASTGNRPAARQVKIASGRTRGGIGASIVPLALSANMRQPSIARRCHRIAPARVVQRAIGALCGCGCTLTTH